MITKLPATHVPKKKPTKSKRKTVTARTAKNATPNLYKEIAFYHETC
jgi:hypothetical protein